MDFLDVIIKGLVYGFLCGFVSFFMGYGIKSALNIFSL